jgi:hypothetical protein
LRLTVYTVGSLHDDDTNRLAVKETNRMLKEITTRIDRGSVNIPIRDPGRGMIYIDAAGACRQLRVALKTSRCRRSDDLGHDSWCHHDSTATALETLQKHAYQEIRTIVLMAVGKRFPKEIADLVIEQAFSAEGVPMDPVVFCDDDDYFWKSDLRPEYKCPSGCTYLGLDRAM